GAVEHEHEGPSYIAVFIYLTLLTGAELGIYAMSLPKTVMVGALVALALAKATLVAMYFMHLAVERKGLWIVAGVPLVIIGFCYFMLRPDLSRRSWASHQEDVVIGHREAPETGGIPQVPQGSGLSNADQPAGSQVGQPNAAPAGQNASGSAAAPAPPANQ
ncbi:MAG TPA: cytochrome C oxidase subunit IV family protein, partial [Candidatus Binataceae bacterium]|nr:cytochrome C oxidase subunit IV family protein [Candidatus Binataceae bacterium]